ncbi:Hypothetical predicted protein [Pelobates cultripes]|uniref:Uncharacterized protein n=1 Tax=Pelobates cultripes TaxID=61616 RepID=A0AAD1VTH0_PELCU|nr:Hypothetical predicted protein [Pelobates cultripes]
MRCTAEEQLTYKRKKGGLVDPTSNTMQQLQADTTGLQSSHQAVQIPEVLEADVGAMSIGCRLPLTAAKKLEHHISDTGQNLTGPDLQTLAQHDPAPNRHDAKAETGRLRNPQGTTGVDLAFLDNPPMLFSVM